MEEVSDKVHFFKKELEKFTQTSPHNEELQKTVLELERFLKQGRIRTFPKLTRSSEH